MEEDYDAWDRREEEFENWYERLQEILAQRSDNNSLLINEADWWSNFALGLSPEEAIKYEEFEMEKSEKKSKKKTAGKKRHNLNPEQQIQIAKAQGWKCPLLGTPLINENGKVVDPLAIGKGYPHRAAPIDHDHTTGNIRGILSQIGNWLEGRYMKGAYGTLDVPQGILRYRENPPAFKAVGKIQFKK
jgi:hypothetical protein